MRRNLPLINLIAFLITAGVNFLSNTGLIHGETVWAVVVCAFLRCQLRLDLCLVIRYDWIVGIAFRKYAPFRKR